MNKDLLACAGINCDSGLTRFMGNEPLYEKMLVKFLEDSCFSDARAAFDTGDYDRLYFCVHSLKGLSGNLSLTDVYNTTAQVLSLLKSQVYSGRLSEAMDKLGAAYHMAVRAISDACTQ